MGRTSRTPSGKTFFTILRRQDELTTGRESRSTKAKENALANRLIVVKTHSCFVFHLFVLPACCLMLTLKTCQRNVLVVGFCLLLLCFMIIDYHIRFL